MKINRFCGCTEYGSFGKLFIQGQMFYTLEPPWLDNESDISCIPTGEYALIPYTSEEHGQTFKLVNVNNHVYPDEVTGDGRYDIIIHIGNIKKNTKGCILIGKGLGFINNQWAITNSGDAMDEIRALWHKEKPLRVTIT